MSYCSVVKKLESNDPNIEYHDKVYGFPIESDNELFGRLILEINQAGLSWTTILKKSEAFRKAYSDFDVKLVSEYKEKDIQRLLNDAGIIRNRLKINAAIHNANLILELINEEGSFKNWLDMHHPLDKDEWVKVFKKRGFKFVGGEIINEFLLSTSYLKGAHVPECSVYSTILKLKPYWNK